MWEAIIRIALEAGLHGATTYAHIISDSDGGSLSGAPVYDLNDAYDLTSQIIEKDPRHAQAWFLRGVISQSLQCYDEALADFSEAIRIDPRHAKALMLRSEVYFRLGEDDKGRSDRQAALVLDPTLA